MEKTRAQKVQFIIDYFNDHYKWQKLVYDWEIDRNKIEAMTDEQLDQWIEKYCK